MFFVDSSLFDLNAMPSAAELVGTKRAKAFIYVFHTNGCPPGGLCCGQELSGMDQEWSGKLFLKNWN